MQENDPPLALSKGPRPFLFLFIFLVFLKPNNKTKKYWIAGSTGRTLLTGGEVAGTKS